MPARCVICHLYHHFRKQRHPLQLSACENLCLDPRNLHQRIGQASSDVCLAEAHQEPTLQQLFRRSQHRRTESHLSRGRLRSILSILITDRGQRLVIVRISLISSNRCPRCHRPVRPGRTKRSHLCRLPWPRSHRPSSGDARSRFRKPRSLQSWPLTLHLLRNRLFLLNQAQA